MTPAEAVKLLLPRRLRSWRATRRTQRGIDIAIVRAETEGDALQCAQERWLGLPGVISVEFQEDS